MKVCGPRFNLYLALILALAMTALDGCKSSSKDDNGLSAIRVHVQAGSDRIGASDTVNVIRSHPVEVTVGHDPILTEASVVAAKVVNTPGGFAVEVQFDETGGWMLEQHTAANPGKHLVIFGQWGAKIADGRWLAAPLISKRIANGRIAFTPDATREETDRFVAGLNKAAKKNAKGIGK